MHGPRYSFLRLWDYLVPQNDLCSLYTLDLLVQFVVFDCSLEGQDGNGELDDNPVRAMEASLFHTCVSQVFECPEWQVRFAGLDNLFGLFCKLDDVFAEAMENSIWLFGPLVSYFVACLTDTEVFILSAGKCTYRRLNRSRSESKLLPTCVPSMDLICSYLSAAGKPTFKSASHSGRGVLS